MPTAPTVERLPLPSLVQRWVCVTSTVVVNSCLPSALHDERRRRVELADRRDHLVEGVHVGAADLDDGVARLDAGRRGRAGRRAVAELALG